jgi:membrane fusion protein (multidrug efflux system)
VYPHEGRIIFADRQVDTQTGTIRIVGAFVNPGNILRPGQFAHIRAMTALRKGALLVPQRAITELQGRYQADVVGPDNKIEVRTVQIGDRVGSLWIVESGLQAGERVVSQGNSKVQEGALVRPEPDTTDTQTTGVNPSAGTK